MKLVYEWEMGGSGGEETKLNLLNVTPGEAGSDFMDAAFEGVRAHIDEIDDKLSAFLQGWTIERLMRVDLAILRLAVYELMYTRTPGSVVINEAIELADQYSTDKSGAFINGVLGNLSRSLADA